MPWSSEPIADHLCRIHLRNHVCQFGTGSTTIAPLRNVIVVFLQGGQPMEPQRAITEKFLTLLQQWGWEAGIEKIEKQLAKTENEAERRVVQSFLGWMAAERGDHERAEATLSPLTEVPELAGWGFMGLAFVAMRKRDTDLALHQLEQAERLAQEDPALLGIVRLLQGTTRFHRAETAGVLELLEDALRLLGPDRFSRGRALNALGMWYANRDNVQAALEFFQQALSHDKRFQDDAGLAVTHGQLGRMFLDWGHLDLAERHFRDDLEICRRITDRRGEAQMHNLLGVVALAHRDFQAAADYLDHSIAKAQSGGWTVLEAYARKDRALCGLMRGDTALACEQLDLAKRLFEQVPFAEGMAHVSRARGILLRQEKKWDDADRYLRQALNFFQHAREQAEIARTRLELARLLKEQGAPQPVIRDEFLLAVAAAEKSRRPNLVQEADRELNGVDPATSARYIYRRVRGRRIDEDSTSLTSAEQDTVTVFFFDLQGFTAWSSKTDPSVVILCLNQMMATFIEATTRHEVQVIEYMGDGFLALSRGPYHARRAARAALDLNTALDEFNRPRHLLGLSEFTCRIGISTGEVVLGNVGTYEKIDYRAVGTTVNLAARIQNVALPPRPCVSHSTWEVIQHDFVFDSQSPRKVELKGIGIVQVWDLACPLQ